MGTSVASLYNDTTDPQASTGGKWKVCGNHYVIDGITGVTDPAGTLGGQGFKFLGQGGVSIGCTSTGAQTDVTVKNIEVAGYGLMPWYPQAVTGCSWSGGAATITTAGDIGGDGTTDKVGGWNSASTILFHDTHATSISSNTVVVPLGSCPTGLAYVGLDFIPGGWVSFGGGNTRSYSNSLVQGVYIHNSGGMSGYNLYNVSFLNNYVSSNRSTPTYHSNMILFGEGAYAEVSGPIYFYRNVLWNASGTSTINNMHIASSPYGGTTNGLYIFSNIVGCDSTDFRVCGVSSFFSDDNGDSGVTQNALLLNNTFVNVPLNGGKQGMYLLCTGSNNCAYAQHGGAGTGCLSNSYGCSSSGTSKNNLFYNVPGGTFGSSAVGVVLIAKGGAASGFSVQQAHNSLVNSGVADSVWTCSAASSSDVCHSSGQTNPFVDSVHGNYKPNSPFTGAATSNSQWAIGDSSLPAPFNAPPFNQDFYGTTFGSTTGYARGAIEFGSGGGGGGNPTAQVGPSSIVFGTQQVSTTSASLTVTISNVGSASSTLAISSIAITTGTSFAISGGTCGSSFPVNLTYLQECTVTVTFNPSPAGFPSYSDALSVTDNDGGVAGSTQVVTLSGTGSAPLTLGSGTWGSGTIN
jgi:hypothetical protein